MRKLLLLSILSISSIVHARELCDDKKNDKSLGHIHYIQPNLNYPASYLPSKKFDLVAHQENIKIDISLNLVGFDEFPGGFEVEQDLSTAKQRLEKILASKIFKDEVNNHRYSKKYQFKKNNGFSNKEIYQKIMDGADKYDPTIDNTIDMILCPYYSSKSVIGYTYSNRKEVWVNFKYYKDRFNNFQVSDMIGNILHEWIHNTGFSHSSRRNKTRKYTVPYGVGDIARDIAGSLD